MTAACLLVPLVGCGAQSPQAVPRALLEQARPIGRGPRFQPPVRGAIPGRCTPRLGRRFAAHVEVFDADRVVVVARGIGVRGPVRLDAGRIVAARCFGTVVTLEPTGVVLVRRGAGAELGTLFRAWGLALSRYPRAYVAGRRWRGAAGGILLRPHAEVVVEAGPFVPPHARYEFPPDRVLGFTPRAARGSRGS